MNYVSTRRASGFTIVELLIVIVVIGVLAAITVVAFRGIQERGQSAAAMAEQVQLVKKLDMYKVQGDVYPASITDCPTPAATNVCLQPKAGQTLSYFAFNPGTPPRYPAAIHTTASPAYELELDNAKGFYYSSNAEITHTNEFVQYMDMAPMIDKYGLRPYKITFDIKSASVASNSNINVYLQNGSGARYTFGDNVTVSTTYERKSVTVTPTGPYAGETQAILAFYGVYGTGNRATIKNVVIQAG